VVANGGGRNGKGVLNDLMLKMLGNFGYTGSCLVLLEGLKSGANPEVANMSRKRMVVWREPPEDRAIQFSVVKELTGGSKINARALYSNDVETHIDACFLMECNAKPRLEGDTGYSMSERVVDVPFVSTYLPKDKIRADMENVYEANPLYKESQWQEEHKHQFIS
jgi:phage/plasmid-associated DNA primase